MAYRRKQGMQRSATFVEDHRQSSSSSGGVAASASSPAIASPRATRFADDSRRPERSSALGARARIATSAALGGDLPAFGERLHSAPASARAADPLQDPVTQLFTSPTNLNDEGSKYDLELSKKDDTRHGFWALVAQKAKVMLDENGTPRESHSHESSQSRWSYDRVRSSESPLARRGSETKLDIGGKIKTVLEKEGLAVGESRGDAAAAAVSPAVRRLQIRRKACSMDLRGAHDLSGLASPDMSPMMSDTESPQIKASRDVANAMAAKVKLLQRELKTVKAELAFSKERSAQLEEENRLLRDGNHDADEDLIRQQLETLLAEKARLARENTLYAHENRFLREIVEFHQLNMQDVVNLDDDIEEEYEEEIEEEEYEEDVNAEPEFDRYEDDLRASSHCLEEEAENFPLKEDVPVPDNEPLSSSQETETQMLSTNSANTTGNDSTRILSTNSGGTAANESPRMPGTNSGGVIEDDGMHQKDDGSFPETTS